MAKGQKFTVALPNGTVATRTSATKTYTHAVVSEQHPAALAADERVQAASHRDQADKYEAEGRMDVVATLLEYARRHDAKAAEYEAMTEPVYVVMRWSGSEENAHKAARGEFDYFTKFGPVYVVQVDEAVTA